MNRTPLFARMAGDINVSFEFFPPKSDAMEAQLWDAIRALAPLDPAFVSVTYGAGGSTRERTHATVARLVRETALVPAAHLTCVGASRGEIDEIADRYWGAGVRHIVALRGDPPPSGGGVFVPHPDGYANAADLVAGLSKRHAFELSVAAYPEMHPESAGIEADLDNLKRKIDAGATRAITQFFFNADTWFRFVDRVLAAGIDVPLLPGIMPVTNLCRALYAGGVRDFHFYTLNRAEQVFAICQLLGLRPSDALVRDITA